MAAAAPVAGALLSLLVWWMDDPTRGSPDDMDDLYHQLFWRGISEG